MFTNQHEIWLTHNAESDKILLPVNPEKIMIRNSSNNSAINLVDLGEILIMQDRSALQFSWSSFFPAAYFPGLRFMATPTTLVDKINSWKSTKIPVHFIDTGLMINVYAAIDSFDYHEIGGDPGTIYYSITLKEYREVSMRKVKVI